MSHDYARKKSTTKKTASGGNAQRVKKPAAKTGLPRWAFFLMGVFATITVQVIYHLAQKSPQVEQVVNQAKQAVTPEPKKPAKPDITFYKTLPDMKVKVDVETVPDRAQESYNYALQAGSFRSKDDANQQRAEIMLMGLDARIESSTNAQGSTWHRVIVGPFTSRSDLNKARNILVSNNMPTLTIKRD